MSGLFGQFEKALFGKQSVTSEEAALPGPPVSPAPIPLVQVQESKWNARLRRFLGLTSNIAAQAFGAEPYPAIALNRFNAENYFPEEPLGWCGLTVAAGGAGNFSAVGVANPAGSGLLTVIEEMSASLTVNGVLQVFTDPVTAFTTTATIFARDGRFPSWAGNFTPPNLVSFSGLAAVVGTGPIVLRAALASVTATWSQPIIVSPGHTVYIIPGAANIGITAEFFVRLTTIPKA